MTAFAGEEVLDLGGDFLAPGFVDLHVHGALGRDTMEADGGAFLEICRYHASGGTTALALTTVTCEQARLLRVLEAVEAFRASDGAGQVLGAHVEGPYLSAAKAGAQSTRWIRDPVRAEWMEIMEFAESITQMTLAPELPGALDLIAALAERRVIASGGHSDAWDEQAREAFARGMRQTTHTFNCMSSARRRGLHRVAGLLEFALSEPEISCELIADGQHVAPTLMRLLYRAKGADGICLVTDSTAAAGLKEGTHFQLGDTECVIENGVAIVADRSALAGSTMQMIDAVRNMHELTGAPLFAAVKMATLNPAQALGLGGRKGRLAAGAEADLVRFSDRLTVVQTWSAGKLIYAAD